jgi:ABC-2 type transport system ATP-binding protein
VSVIAAERLSKDYGSGHGVFDLDFEVQQGEVFAFLGPNGAGKTTTIRLMLDLIRPTRGRIEIFGLDVRARAVEIHRRLGYLTGDLRLYERMSGGELIRHFAGLRGIGDLTPARQIAQRLQLDLDRPIRTLSRGNRQKLGLLQATMHSPDLLVLDEPTSGLDPLVQQVFHQLVREATARGGTVFLSSHVLSEVQQIADRVALVRDGRLALVESVQALRELASMRVEATFQQPPPADAFLRVPGVSELERHGREVVFSLAGPVDPLIKALAAHTVLALDVHEADLQDVFLDLYRGDVERDMDKEREGMANAL